MYVDRPETIRMSSKGQVVVPKKVRELIGAEKEDEFLVYGKGDYILLKKLERRKDFGKEFERVVSEMQKRVEKAGYDKKALDSLVEEAIAESRRAA